LDLACENIMKNINRRDTLKLLGAGAMLGLRSLASGIPISVLADPRRALAFERNTATASYTPQFLVLSTSGNGDPLNANVPGSYLNANIMHPQQASMAPTTLTLNGASYTAAAPWASLPQNVLDRSVFFHHATNTVVHPDEPKVMQLLGAVSNKDNMLSMLAAQLGPTLGTVQSAPITLGAQGASELISYQGRPQAGLNPTALGSVLGDPNSPMSSLQQMRDADLDALNQWFKQQGNPSQGQFIDRYATSIKQTRETSESLLSSLTAIKDNSVTSQLAAAVILIQMKIAPIFTVHLPFGGDNHGDSALNGEAAQHVSSLTALNTFFTHLASAGLSDQVTFATLNVFGRTLNVAQNYVGRNHQENHHVAVMIGKNFQGGVIGGVTPLGSDFGALAIDSQTGQGMTGGDINLANSLPAMGKTLGAGLGVSTTALNSGITGGAIVNAALSST
jgi:hypothetical protein